MYDPKLSGEIQDKDLPPTGLELIIAERERQTMLTNLVPWRLPGVHTRFMHGGSLWENYLDGAKTQSRKS